MDISLERIAEDEELAGVIAAYETSTIELVHEVLRSLYYGLDEFSFTGQDRVPELCDWLAHRIVDRHAHSIDSYLVIRQICYSLRASLVLLDQEGSDALAGASSWRPTGARGGESATARLD